MASVASRTLANVNSSAIIARHPDVPNLILAIGGDHNNKMTDKIIVFVTCESKEQAETIAQTVVTGRLAACVNVLPGIRSCYIWEQKLTWSDEVLLLIKTSRSRFGQLQDRIKALHSYSVPEIVGVTIDDAFEKYIDWIESSVGS